MDFEEASGGDFTVSACRELVDEFPCHVLVFNDGEAWEVHISM